MYKKLLLYALISLINLSVALAMDEDENDKKNNSECYIIFSENDNIDLGTITKEQIKNFLNEYSQKIVKFVIKTCNNGPIVIKKLEDIYIDGFEIKSEWRMGPVTGMEEQFNDIEEVKPTNKQYVVTLKIKSIKLTKEINAGRYTVKPSISVEKKVNN